MIDLHDVSKVYQIGEERVHALDHVTLHIFPKEFVSVIGPSGSGKSTLMNIIGCLDVADAGTYRLDGIPIEDYSEKQLARVRNQKIGFIFQNFNLIAKLSAEENVELPLVYRGVRPAERAKRVAAALERDLTPEMSSPLHIVPGGYDDVRRAISWPGTKVVMKARRSLADTKCILREEGAFDGAELVEDCGLPGERVYRSVDDVPDRGSYFSTMVVR